MKPEQAASFSKEILWCKALRVLFNPECYQLCCCHNGGVGNNNKTQCLSAAVSI